MGAITDNLKLPLEEVKSYCRINTTSDDQFIKDLITSSKMDADNICNNPFGSFTKDGDGDLIETAVLIPTPVKIGCMKYVAYHYVNRGDCAKQNIPEASMSCWKDYILVPGF